MKSMYDFFNSTACIATHCTRWLVSTSSDTTKTNPNFNPETGSGIPIYCVHGTADRNHSFSRIAHNLRHHSDEEALKYLSHISQFEFLTFSNRLTGRSIEDFARQFGEKCRANGHTKIIGMGHSRGSLILAYFTEFLAAEYGVEVILSVSISGPYQGSPLANSTLGWLSESVNEMSIDSSFTEELANRLANSKNHHIFGCGDDDWIVPHNRAYPSTYVRNNPDSLKILTGHGHLSIMSSTRLTNFIIDNIRRVLSLEIPNLNHTDEKRPN